jgi:ATP-dependent DNA helicase RecQ
MHQTSDTGRSMIQTQNASKARRATGQPHAILRERFGLADFREGQVDVIDRLLAGQSTLAIFPTGAGKSLCYQLPALMLDGLTLVISPLIALMKDQIDFLQSRGVPAARLDSSITSEQAVATYRGLHDGSLKLLYVAPERLANERFLQTLSKVKVAMLAVDEAHCISEWGHSFRPDYLKLARLAQRLHVGRVLALTATATPVVAEQIAKAFSIAGQNIVRTGFYRPNLTLRVTAVDEARRDSVLLERIKSRAAGPTIVYVTLQKTAERVAADLRKAGLDAAAYHAGMDADDRTRVQEHFMQSDRAIVVATIAFGMGIDKRNIRQVYHYNLPKSLENYAQEIGRAGRDGQPSICETLACAADRIPLENFVYGDTPEPAAVDSLVREVLLQPEAFDVSPHDLSNRHDIRVLVVETLLTYLQLHGVIESTGPFYSQYKFKWLRDEKAVLAKFDKPRADFLRRVLSSAKLGKTLFTIDVAEAALKMNEDRKRLVSALSYLDEQGDIELEAAGVRQGFRRLQHKHDPRMLIANLNDRFAQREQRDIARLEEVLAFCAHNGCRTQRLMAYFGEPMPKPCGHCSICAGEKAQPLAITTSKHAARDITRAAGELRRLGNDALKTPRQIARFLCGIATPSFSRGKLKKNPHFGVFDDVPLKEVQSAISARSPR